MKKIIILALAVITAGIAHISHCVSYTIPGKPAVNITLANEHDAIAVEDIKDIAADKIATSGLFIMAVVESKDAAGKTYYHYFDAESIDTLHKHNPAKTPTGYAMTDPTNRAPISRVYYFALEKPTDPTFKYLCSDVEMLSGQGSNPRRWQDLLAAYIKGENAKVDELYKGTTSSRKSFIVGPGSSPEYVDIKSYDPYSKQQLQVTAVKKINTDMPFIIAAAVTLDANGAHKIHFYDCSSIDKMYKAAPNKGADGKYKMTEKDTNLPIFAVYYFTLEHLSDASLRLLATDLEILQKNSTMMGGEYTAAAQELVKANIENNAAASQKALAIIKKNLHYK